MAAGVFLRDLIEADAVLGCPVEVPIGGNSLLLRGSQEGTSQAVDVAQIGNVERTVCAVIGGRAVLLMFGLFEIWQDRGEGPAGIAELCPVVEIAGRAADVDHGVDGAGTAEDFAARPVEPAILELRLGFGGIIPVHGGLEEFGEGCGNGNFAGARRAAGFEEQDADVRVLGEASGENATGGAGADNDVVIFGVGGSSHVCWRLGCDARSLIIAAAERVLTITNGA